ncbi:HlyD family type I secretion periplasmic adaptor subunit [Aestuariirhabdus sp. Z084]|uniref:HlyD family type I secretion periplasmic adaptor subunit n=1 Tax=Aestuariirhabdus haliotis TaxID=2918751 RepID=UPI00201B3BD9|nr:HlyD family type I secretion periplasmic adaptor subunit [Aestuariirhabdus haliotis]MCL6417464.1 HlyD family type I secretion periplasmic adaptor subunit [Aestuariirhabdus haliotis]MCL6421417.1 HlyD family type I secretion periplasmic adaptor subunit [Aestuariirhabdus haliotis]
MRNKDEQPVNASSAPDSVLADKAASNGSPVREADLYYVNDTSAAMLLSAPRHTRQLLYLIAAFITSALIWASFAELDEVTVGIGRVIPSKQLQVVQNLEGGIVKEIYVTEGDLVEQGQPLLLIDDTRFRSDLRESLQERANLQGEIARHKAALQSVQIDEQSKADNWRSLVRINMAVLPLDEEFQLQYPNVMLREQAGLMEHLNNLRSQLNIIERQVAQKEQEQVELASKISHLEASYRLVQEELSLTEPLAREGVVSRVELIKLERQVNEIQSELNGSRLMAPKVSYARQELISKHREVAFKFRSETQNELNDLEGAWSQMSESQIGLLDRVERTTVLSPVKGTVKQINITTVGGVIQPGMDIVEIVPIEDNLLIEAKILPKDIAFLRPGLEAVVKFTAYDFAIYGGLTGKLEQISADTIEDEEGNSFYQVRVRTEKNYLGDQSKPLPIIPGMMAETDVITGKKSVLDYLLKPILRAKQQALRER